MVITLLLLSVYYHMLELLLELTDRISRLQWSSGWTRSKQTFPCIEQGHSIPVLMASAPWIHDHEICWDMCTISTTQLAMPSLCSILIAALTYMQIMSAVLPSISAITSVQSQQTFVTGALSMATQWAWSHCSLIQYKEQMCMTVIPEKRKLAWLWIKCCTQDYKCWLL